MSAILGALKYIPASTARKALEKVNPGFKNYFAKSAAYGLDVNRAIDYLADRFQSDSQRSHKEHLRQGEARNTLRPDELASKSDIENSEMPLKALKTAASFIGGGLLGRDSQPEEEEEQVSPMTPKTIAPTNQQEAVQQYNQRQKKKKLQDQLKDDFANRYGEGKSPGQDPDMQALLQALQQLKQARGMGG